MTKQCKSFNPNQTLKKIKHMIKINICTCILMICMFNLKTVHLQAQVLVTKGSIHKYSVTPLPTNAIYNYNWSASGGTSSIFGTAATSNDILWDGAAGVYSISVYPVKTTSNCSGMNQTLTIAIVDMSIKWSTLVSTQCPKTDNETGAFAISAFYTGIEGPWSFTYNIDDGPGITIAINSGFTSTIIIPGFTNLSVSNNETHVIKITSVTTPDNYTKIFDGTESDSISRSYTVSIEPTPATTEIKQL